jgi:16S rRNA (uracil1498-N3)-methyltransferase
MPHFYIPPENIKESFFAADKEQSNYIANVRRFKKGDEIMIFDGMGKSYKAQILTIDKNSITGKILSSSYKKSPLKVNLYTAMPKNERFEWLIEKCAELGADKIVPIILKRSIIRTISDSKLERAKKISIAASSQCGRNDIMQILPPILFTEAIKEAALNSNSLNILLWESEDKTSMSKLLNSDKGNTDTVNIFIGPEGGFENDEIELAKELNMQMASLGENILRVETAALSAIVLTMSNRGL